MKRGGWIVARDATGLTLARRLPARFDLRATAVFPDASMAGLAHQIRQDVWRLLARLRGFSPEVRVEIEDFGLRVTAGGRLDKGRHGRGARPETGQPETDRLETWHLESGQPSARQGAAGGADHRRAEARIAALLSDGAHRARWLAHAQRGMH